MDHIKMLRLVALYSLTNVSQSSASQTLMSCESPGYLV